MIETFKVLSGTYDEEVAPKLPMGDDKTRGHSKMIYKKDSRINLRKYFFIMRIASIWNKLPEAVVNAKDVRAFKNSLDKHWKSHPGKYDDNHNLYKNVHNRRFSQTRYMYLGVTYRNK